MSKRRKTATDCLCESNGAVMEYVMTFHTHFDAIQYDRFLQSRGIERKLQPVPRELSSSCGTCVRFITKEQVEEGTDFTDHEFEKLFYRKKGNYTMIAERE